MKLLTKKSVANQHTKHEHPISVDKVNLITPLNTEKQPNSTINTRGHITTTATCSCLFNSVCPDPDDATFL